MGFSAARAFHLLASRSSEVITFTNAEGLAVYQSPSIERVLGYTAEELLGTRLMDLVHPDDRAWAEAETARQLAGGEPDPRYELRFRHKDGSWRDLEIVSINALDDPDMRCIVTVSRDVTVRKGVERSLRRADSQLRSLVGGLPLIAYACDMEGRFTYTEGGALAKLGVEPGQAVGVDAFEMYADIPVFVDALRRGLAGESVRYVSESAGGVFDNLHTPFYDDRGEQIGVVGLAIDITEQTQLAAELARAHRLDAIGRLAGGVAHDFNNLLTVILGNAIGALEDVAEDSEPGVAITDIVTAAEQGAELTQQLLAFARRQRVDPRLTDLTRLVAATTSMLRRAVSPELTYRVQLDSDGVAIVADPGQLEQVLVNLVLNARDAMAGAGTLTIRTRRLAPHEQPFEAEHELTGKPLVVIEVADTGTGMDAATVEHIFEPFFTTKPQGKGTGLGLASSLGIVRQAGGELRVESAPGEGSTFRIYLPIAPGELPPSPEPAASASGRYGTETLLLVEDFGLVGDVAADALTQAGYTVLRAANGLEALSRIAAHDGELDALVTDLVMPRLGGRELAERLHRDRPDLPVLFLSGATSFDSIRTGPSRRLLTKPFRPEQLCAEVRALLDGHPTAAGALGT